MSHSGTWLLCRSRAGVGGNGGECVSCICLAKVPSHAGALPQPAGTTREPSNCQTGGWCWPGFRALCLYPGCGVAMAGLFSCVGVMGCFLTWRHP